MRALLSVLLLALIIIVGWAIGTTVLEQYFEKGVVEPAAVVDGTLLRTESAINGARSRIPGLADINGKPTRVEHRVNYDHVYTPGSLEGRESGSLEMEIVRDAEVIESRFLVMDGDSLDTPLVNADQLSVSTVTASSDTIRVSPEFDGRILVEVVERLEQARRDLQR